jgi:hypothetical protein
LKKQQGKVKNPEFLFDAKAYFKPRKTWKKGSSVADDMPATIDSKL